jgi:hypothetical protein
LEDADLAFRMPPEDLLAPDEALARLAAEDPVKSRLVELCFFAGLTLEEAATAFAALLLAAGCDGRTAVERGSPRLTVQAPRRGFFRGFPARPRRVL